ncbi:hypothetical protein BJV74DRAFT_845468 [Russula compacta]|nr:hypothetical protein BJV74DRAFT_845468 [Russula compacta]
MKFPSRALRLTTHTVNYASYPPRTRVGRTQTDWQQVVESLDFKSLVHADGDLLVSHHFSYHQAVCHV